MALAAILNCEGSCDMRVFHTSSSSAIPNRITTTSMPVEKRPAPNDV